MTTSSIATARELARDNDGQFGTQIHSDDVNPETMGSPETSTPLIAGLGDMADPQINRRILDASYRLNSDERYDREQAQYEVERELKYLTASESSQHLSNIAKVVHAGNAYTREHFAAIDAAIDDNDNARTAAGIALVDSSYTPPGFTAIDGYGPNATQGERFTGYPNVTEVAKECRLELKKAQAAGYLPADLNFRVTVDKYTGGQSMRIEVIGLNDKQILEQDHLYARHGYTEDALELRNRVDTIADACNKQDIDSQSDYFNVAYYSHVELEQESSRDWRVKETARKKAMRYAHK